MAKRFSDTDKWKKPFIRGLQGPYKLLWFYILDDCDHAGIWQVDKEVAELRIGMPIEWDVIPTIFHEKIIFANEHKWFIPDFIDFQYGQLNPQNRLHSSVISLLEKNNLLEIIEKNKGLTSSLQGAKDKYKEKDKEKDKEIKGGLGENLTEVDVIDAEYVPDIDIPEEELAAALAFFKNQSFYNISRKQHMLDEQTIDDYFRRFYEKRFGELHMERKRMREVYRTEMDLIKHFYNQLPYLKKTIAQTTIEPKNGTTNFNNRKSSSAASNANENRAKRDKLNAITNAVLLGAQAQ